MPLSVVLHTHTMEERKQIIEKTGMGERSQTESYKKSKVGGKNNIANQVVILIESERA